MTEPARWLYRFDNFRRALALLREAVALSQQRPLSALEQEGLIQRFEFCWELAWKVQKDFLAMQGVQIDTITPATVIRAALTARLIDQGDAWMEALAARKKTAHTYDAALAQALAGQIGTVFLPLFDDLERGLLPHDSRS
jgi:nucleotidyltransferase substrate binding protein (TIGR01987 family)